MTETPEAASRRDLEARSVARARSDEDGRRSTAARCTVA